MNTPFWTSQCMLMSIVEGAAMAYKTIQDHEIRFRFAEYELESQLNTNKRKFLLQLQLSWCVLPTSAKRRLTLFLFFFSSLVAIR